MVLPALSAKHLDLDAARLLQILFDEDVVVTERGASFSLT